MNYRTLCFRKVADATTPLSTSIFVMRPCITTQRRSPMTLRSAIELFRDHQKNSDREKTRESYSYLFRNLEALLGDTAIDDISSQDLYQFLLLLTEGCARSTARLRYAQLKAFFNFVIESIKAAMINPCNDPLLSKTFRAPRTKQRDIMGREVIDEIIYRCRKVRDRLILELQARCGLRIGEVLGLPGIGR